jgi:DNA (cytosine-5)-methyltransferase 1
VQRTKNLTNIEKINGVDIVDGIDLMTYSFPCQDLSNMGAIHGYNNGIDKDKKSRSGLLWQVDRILFEKDKSGGKMPRYLLMENVPSLLSDRHKDNFNLWKQQLNDLGYYNKEYLINSRDLGIPQNRQRLIMLSVFLGKNFINNNYSILKDYLDKMISNKSCVLNPIKKYLRMDYKNIVYLNEAIAAQPNDTESRRSIWENNTKILDNNGIYSEYSSTITTKQDRHPNAGNVYFKTSRNNFRFLTPRECFLLMGFDEDDYESIVNNNFYTGQKDRMFFTRDKLYKLAGNSIVVNMLYEVMKNISTIDKILESN